MIHKNEYVIITWTQITFVRDLVHIPTSNFITPTHMTFPPRFQFSHKEHTQWTADTYEIAWWLFRLFVLMLSSIPFLAPLYNEVHKIKALCGAHSYMSVCLSAWFNLLHYLAEFDEANITGSALEMSDKCTSGSSRSSVACIVNRHTDLYSRECSWPAQLGYSPFHTRVDGLYHCMIFPLVANSYVSFIKW